MPKITRDKRIRVHSQYGATETVDAARAEQLSRADNAVVRRGADGEIVTIFLRSFTAVDNDQSRRRGNPQNLVTQSESATNPPGVWAFKRLAYA